MEMNKKEFITTLELIGKPSASQFHLLPDPSGCRVSSRSLWKDPVWYLDGPSFHARTTFNWSFDLPDGTQSADSQHSELLDCFKRFYWSMLVDPRHGRGWTPKQVPHKAGVIKHVMQWMVLRVHHNLSTIDADAVDQFKEDLAAGLEVQDIQADDADLSRAEEADKTEDEAILEEEEVAVEMGAGEPGSFYNSVFRNMCIWQALWLQSTAFAEAGIPVLPADPLGGKSARAVAADIATQVIRHIAPLPDEVAIPIMNECHLWLGLRADDVIRLVELCCSIAIEMADSEKGDWSRMTDAQAERLAKFTFSVELGAQEPWHAPIRLKKVEKENRSYWLSHSIEVRNLVEKVAMAAGVVVQSDTGMRISEAVSPPAGRREDGTLKAIEKRLSKSGLNELFFIRSTLYKTSKSPKPEEWLAGSRPVGSLFVPGPKRAVEVMDRLFRWVRQTTNDPETRNALFIQLPRPSGIGISTFVDGSACSPRTIKNFRLDQKWFVADCVDLSALPNRSRLGEDLVPYRESKGACIKPHQWRKTWAMYMVRTDPRMVPAVALQFKHMSMAMTESAYISDAHLLREWESQQHRAAAAFMYQAVTGKDHVGGRMAKLIDEYTEQISRRIAGKEAVTAINSLQELCAERGIGAESIGPGKCFIRLKPAEARCHQLAGTTSWRNKKPNHAFREPDVCKGCACFGVDRDHIPFWRDRYIENQRSWIQAQKCGLKEGFRPIQKRAAESAAMLREFGEQLPETEGQEHA